MAVKTDKPPGLVGRIRDRHHRANEFLDGTSPGKRAWAKAHLYVADATDAVVTTVNNQFTYTATGVMQGIGRGLIYGALIGLAVATAFPLLTMGAVGATVTGLGLHASWVPFISTFFCTAVTTSAIYGVKDGFTAYEESQRENMKARGAKVAEKICKHGHAVGDKIPKEFDKATQRVIEREHIKPPPPPHPADGENHSFVDAVVKSRELESQGIKR
jgi:hypothetical protein